MAAPMLPPDKGTPHRDLVTRWDNLWHGRYLYDQKMGTRSNDRTVNAAPGYSRSWSRLVAGLFQRQTPSYDGDPTTVPLDQNELSDLLFEITSKAAGNGYVVVRPVYDGAGWVPSVLTPVRTHVEWAHRRPVKVIAWDYSNDPRHPDDDKRGLAVIETWTPNPDGPGDIVTAVYETTANTGRGTVLEKQVSVDNPPAGLEDHPFVVSAQNDNVPRDVFVYVWAWEDIGPVSIWYTNEGVLDGLARLWDQEQDDAELTRKRIAMPQDLVGTKNVYADDGSTVIARPGFNKHDNLLLVGSGMSAEHGPGGGVVPIEFGDDLVQRERIEGRENSALENVGINPASIGRHVGGRSDSASAKRADNQMTMNTITAPARHAEQTLSQVTTELARLTNTIATAPFVVSVFEGLKENPVESAETAGLLRDADAASVKTRVETAHPTWTEPEIDAEVEAIKVETAAASFL